MVDLRGSDQIRHDLGRMIDASIASSVPLLSQCLSLPDARTKVCFAGRHLVIVVMLSGYDHVGVLRAFWRFSETKAMTSAERL